jgi:hypothetical protein
MAPKYGTRSDFRWVYEFHASALSTYWGQMRAYAKWLDIRHIRSRELNGYPVLQKSDNELAKL